MTGISIGRNAVVLFTPLVFISFLISALISRYPFTKLWGAGGLQPFHPAGHCTTFLPSLWGLVPCSSPPHTHFSKVRKMPASFSPPGRAYRGTHAAHTLLTELFPPFCEESSGNLRASTCRKVDSVTHSSQQSCEPRALLSARQAR